MILVHEVLDSSVGPHEFRVQLKDGHAELWLPGATEAIMVTEGYDKRYETVYFSIDIPGEPRPIRMKAWLLIKHD